MPAPNELPEAVRVLIAYAEGRVRHANTGRCPDSIEGPKSRTKGCPVCDAIIGTRTLATYADLLRAAGDGREADARRYRWLRERAVSVIDWAFMPNLPDGSPCPLDMGASATLDAAIDAAAGAQGNPAT